MSDTSMPAFDRLPVDIRAAIIAATDATFDYAESDDRDEGPRLYAECTRTKEALAALLLPYVEPAADDLGQVPADRSIEAGALPADDD